MHMNALMSVGLGLGVLKSRDVQRDSFVSSWGTQAPRARQGGATGRRVGFLMLRSQYTQAHCHAQASCPPHTMQATHECVPPDLTRRHGGLARVGQPQNFVEATDSKFW